MEDATPLPPPRRAGRPAGVVLDTEILQARRHELAWTQEDLADRAGVALRTVKTAEAGGRVAALTAQFLTTALGLPYASVVRLPAEVLEASGRLARVPALLSEQPLSDRAREAWDQLQIFGDAPFSERWATVATGLEGIEARRVLAELCDRFALDEVGPTPRGARRFRRSRSGGEAAEAVVHDEQLQRALALAPAWQADDLPRHLRELGVALPQWRLMFDAAADAVRSESPIQPTEGPVALSPRPVPPGAAALLHHPLLHVIVRFFGPRQSPHWITSALALARARGDDAQVGALSGLYGWWWISRRGAVDLADQWLQSGWEAHRRTGRAEDIVQSGCLSALFAWMARGHAAAFEIREEALRVARSAPVRWETLVTASISHACSLALRGRPDQAKVLLIQAGAVVPDDGSRQARMARAALELDRACCRRLLGRAPSDLARVADAARELHDEVLHLYPLAVLRLDELVRWLGCEPLHPELTARAALQTVSPEAVTDQLPLLMQLCAELRVPLGGVHPEAAAVDTAQGPMSRFGITLGDGCSVRLHLEVLSPIGGLRGVLAGECACLALEFVDRVAGADHVLRPALQDLVRRGGLVCQSGAPRVDGA